jgi:hypothetical protein
MSIKERAFELCKTVWQAPDYPKVKEVFSSLPEEGWSSFEQYAKQMCRYSGQFLMPLVLDRLSEESRFAAYLPDPGATNHFENRFLTLKSAHRQMLRLNEKCLAPLTSISPICADILDPYNQYRYAAVKLDEAPDIAIYGERAADDLAEAFREHPAVVAVLKEPAFLKQLPINPRLIQDIWSISEAMAEAGPLAMPESFARGGGGGDVDVRDPITSLLCRSMACIRESLSVINQLVYQAFFQDRLGRFDRENCMAIRRHFQGSGGGISLIHQDTLLEFVVEPNDVVLVQKSWLGEMEGHLLCRVEGTVMSPNPSEFGTVCQVVVRVIDDNLNPFSALLPRPQ